MTKREAARAEHTDRQPDRNNVDGKWHQRWRGDRKANRKRSES